MQHRRLELAMVSESIMNLFENSRVPIEDRFIHRILEAGSAVAISGPLQSGKHPQWNSLDAAQRGN
jgi:hypothetical protein